MKKCILHIVSHTPMDLAAICIRINQIGGLITDSMCLSAEDTFLSAIINYTNSSTVHFKLSPTYVLYMACRYVLSPSYRPDMSPSERTHKVIAIVNKMVSMMEGVIQVSKPSSLIFCFCVCCDIWTSLINLWIFSSLHNAVIYVFRTCFCWKFELFDA